MLSGRDADGQEAPALEARAIHKSFGAVAALQGVDLRCRPGTVHALIGENGAGKSTLVGVLTGVHRPDAGEVAVGGHARSFRSPRDALGAGVATVFQELTVLPDLTVADNVLLGQEVTRFGVIGRAASRHRVESVLRELAGDGIPADAPARRLSISQQQVVEIARALVRDARVLIMDEPSAVLAGEELSLLFRLIRRLAERGVSVVYVSHRLEEIETVADDITILRDGRVASSGPVSGYTREAIVQDMVGRALTEPAAPAQTARAEPVLAMEGLRLVPGDLEGVHLDVHRGEVVGVAGLMGSGRSRLARSIVGLTGAPGSVRVHGRPLDRRGTRTAAAQGVVLVPEDRRRQGLALDLSVEDNLILAVRGRLSRFGVLPRAARRQAAEQAVQRLDIRLASVRQPVRSLSGGNQQKVLLARWLACEPEVLLLDEPFRGVDVGAKAEIFDVIRRLREEGMATVLISSDLPELISLSDRVLVMKDGRSAGELPHAQASEERIMALAVAGVGVT